MELHRKLSLPEKVICDVVASTKDEMSKLGSALSQTHIHFLKSPLVTLARYLKATYPQLPLLNSCILFHRPSDYQQETHIDCNNAVPPERISCAINIPIENCFDSYMEWFDGLYTTELKSRAGTDGVTRSFIDLHWEKPLFLLDRVIIDSPTLVRVNVPHRVSCTKLTRSLITLRFAGNPAYDDIAKLLST